MNTAWINRFGFFAASAFCGWFAAFAMPQVSFWPCLFLGLSGLYYLWGKTSGPGMAFGTGFFFALGYFITGLWWIGNALLVDGNEFAWVWPISVIGLPTLLGLFTATYLAIARMLANPKSLTGFFAFTFFLTFSEWARGNAFTGFPWNLYGYVWSDHIVMAQIAHYIGAYGLTLLSVLWAAMAGFLLLQKRTPLFYALSLSCVIATMAGTYLFGHYRLQNHATEYDPANAVVVVQPNIAQDMKWDPEAIQENYLKILSLSKGATFGKPRPKNVFIVWPETAISPAVYARPENMDLMRQMMEHYHDENAYLITGVLRRTENKPGDIGSANSMILLNARLSALDIYDKSHLVPFGEFIPMQNWIPLKPVASFRGFDRGKGTTTISRPGIPPFSPLICYEVIFPDKVVKTGTGRPRWMVNSTNDGWYGDSAGPHQHFAQTRMRAIEEGLPLIRSANTGISGIIDSYGRIVDQVDIFEEGILVSNLPLPLPASPSHGPWLFQILLPLIAIPWMIARFVWKK